MTGKSLPAESLVPSPRTRGRMHARRGFSLLEIQVALVLFGLSLAGLFPLVAVYSRGVGSLERRIFPQNPCYLVPAAGEWTRKLGASAQLTARSPGPAASAPVLLVDDGDTGFTAGPTWDAQSDGSSYQGDYRLRSAGASADAASWHFSGLTPGWYEVQATWSSGADRATSAFYTIFDGDSAQMTCEVHQQNEPSGVSFGGRRWQSLATVPIASGTARVDLGSSTNGSVAADGVRLVPKENDVRVLSCERSSTSEQVTVRVSVGVKVP